MKKSRATRLPNTSKTDIPKTRRQTHRKDSPPSIEASPEERIKMPHEGLLKKKKLPYNLKDEEEKKQGNTKTLIK